MPSPEELQDKYRQVQVQAEAGQDWEQLAKSMGIDVGDLIKANPLDMNVKAGAVYNVPAQPLSMVTGSTMKMYQQPYYGDKRIPEGMSVQDYIDSQIQPTPTPEPRNYIKELLTSGGGREGEQIGETINRLTQPIRDWFLPSEEPQSYLPGKTKVMASVVPQNIPGTYTPAQPYSAVTGSQQYQQPYVPPTPLSETTGYISPQDRAYQPSTAFYDPTIPSPSDAFYAPTAPGLSGTRPFFDETQPAAPTLRTEQELRKIPLPPKPSAFEAVNWLTGAGLTGTALLSAGHQLRLDRPEYWDATGGRADVLEGMEKFLIAEFPDGNGGVDWEAAIAQDPYIGATLEKLGYHAPPSGFGEDEVSYGGYSYPLPSYGGGGGGYDGGGYSQSPSLGLVSWSI